jgi:hypothetical protein
MTNLKYPTPLLAAINDGCVLDMRVRLAIELLKVPGFESEADVNIATRVDAALTTAEVLFERATQRGWIADLPLDDSIPPLELAHIRRNAVAQVEGQFAAQQHVEQRQRRVTAVQAVVAPVTRRPN